MEWNEPSVRFCDIPKPQLAEVHHRPVASSENGGTWRSRTSAFWRAKFQRHRVLDILVEPGGEGYCHQYMALRLVVVSRVFNAPSWQKPQVGDSGYLDAVTSNGGPYWPQSTR